MILSMRIIAISKHSFHGAEREERGEEKDCLKDIRKHMKTQHKDHGPVNISEIATVRSNERSRGRVAAGSTRSFKTLEDPPPELKKAYE
jgi:hypothetical protein